MKAQILSAMKTALLTFVLTGIAYPLLVTGLAQILFPHRANGSPVADERGNVVGSELIGQLFVSGGYFHGRPSAAGDKGYDASASSGSNLGPLSDELRRKAAAAMERFREMNIPSGLKSDIPIGMVTASASGLDPHISRLSAMLQAERVAAARGVDVSRVRALIDDQAESFSIFSVEPGVNVLLLNLALDRQFGLTPAN